jgi:hypothetical protein
MPDNQVTVTANYVKNNNPNNNPVLHKLTASKKAKTTKKYIKITKIKYDGKALAKNKKVSLLFGTKKIGIYKLTSAKTLIIKSAKYKKFFKNLKKFIKKKYKKKWKKHYKKNKWITITLSYGASKCNVKVKVLK